MTHMQSIIRCFTVLMLFSLLSQMVVGDGPPIIPPGKYAIYEVTNQPISLGYSFAPYLFWGFVIGVVIAFGIWIAWKGLTKIRATISKPKNVVN
jgi:hypothetical protein